MNGIWTEVGDRVFVGRYRLYDQDIGAIVGAAGVLVVDTRSSLRQAREILDDLADLTDAPVRWFVNTHWHYDHAFGNAELRPAEGWGHAACVDGLLAHAERMRAGLARERPDLADDLALVVIDPPERTFSDRATIDLGGGRTAELRFLGRGHTDSDVVVTVPGTSVTFAGDLIENGAPPYFGDGFPLEWPATIERLLPLLDGPVVPGHGDVADRTFVEEQLANLRSLATLARQAVATGLDVDDVMAEAPWNGGPIVREGLALAMRQLVAEAADERPAVTPEGPAAD